MSDKISSITAIKVGDRFSYPDGGKIYTVIAVHTTEAGTYITYESDKGAVGTVPRTLLTGVYSLIPPFFEEGKKYRFRYSDGKLTGPSYEILRVLEFEGEKVAVYVEREYESKWYGTFTQANFKKYGNEVED